MAVQALNTRHAIAFAAVSTSFAPTAAAAGSSTRRASLSLQTAKRHYVGAKSVLLTSHFSGASVPVERTCSSSATASNASISPRCALVQKVTAKELESILTKERTSPMIIDFYATWCGPCVMLAQDLELLALEYGRDVRFLKVDTDEEHELASEMDIRGLPTMVFVHKDVDKLAIRTEGLLPLPAIRDIIEKEILDKIPEVETTLPREAFKSPS